MDNLRILASCLVREKVSFKHGVSRDFWGISIYRPDWWPADVKFQSPHERRKGCSLNHDDLREDVNAYRGHRHLDTSNEQQQPIADDSTDGQIQIEETNDVEFNKTLITIE
ncbi:hypothetical protein CHS0354_013892 [Potamilus streckersoni]|uniref:Uncharacterized protein n=1 Tax=Potamilus streckersoni TaxID=2493646 RepID=A0AAE0RWS4_9BIVA|nr:hypothetical protein CHS0354_013892 [Potamilus streckersoni]